MSNPRIVLDIGGCTTRAGHGNTTAPKVTTQTAVARAKRRDRSTILTGEKISHFPEIILSRPLTRGLLLDPETLKAILESEIFNRNSGMGSLEKLHAKTSAVIAISPQTPESVTEQYFQVFLDDLKFDSIALIESSIAATFSPSIAKQLYWNREGIKQRLSEQHEEFFSGYTTMVIILGFSGSFIVPIINGRPLPAATRRMSVGGRVMNNYLKEVLAFGQVDLEDSPILIQKIRELCCFVADDFQAGLREIVKGLDPQVDHDRLNGFGVLPVKLPSFQPPDYEPEIALDAGSIKMGRERIAVPEILFRPAIAGLDEPGIVDTVAEALAQCPSPARHVLTQNIIVCGALAQTPGLLDRLKSEIRGNIPADFNLNFIVEEDGRLDLTIFRGCAAAAGDDATFSSLGVVTREQILSQRGLAI